MVVYRIRQSTYVGNSSSRSSHEPNVDAYVFSEYQYLYFKYFILIYLMLVFISSSAQFAFNPKDVVVQRKNLSPSISSKLTESEIKQQINRLSQIYANKVSSNYIL